jgi:hypothetical protein
MILLKFEEYQVPHHNLAYDDVAPPANLFYTPPPLELQTRTPLLVVGARVGAEVGVGVTFADVDAIVVAAARDVVVVAGAQRRPRRVPRQPS